ncbi:Myosin phosphatase Rho-interacting protein [Liparis tanakae]|uniref:Myosin phosphatase Rho-interacting protein n=1 Tax=Liparis tanakae TaxID=230148 RepID=A0A4Z2E585_9TELE|nr:Myosin phosphatase Rho-interacting protein [Liparis tanakae]
MTKLYEDGMWKKHWFVLTDQSLRCYKDSIAEEASELDGEIDLSTCYDVKEFPVQRNYGFQILRRRNSLSTRRSAVCGVYKRPPGLGSCVPGSLSDVSLGEALTSRRSKCAVAFPLKPLVLQPLPVVTDLFLPQRNAQQHSV